MNIVNKKVRLNKVSAVLVLAMILIAGAAMYVHYGLTHSQAIHSRLMSLSASNIEKVTIKNSHDNVAKLVTSDPVTLDPQYVASLLNMIKASKQVQPNHPSSLWQVKVRIEIVNADPISLKVSKTENSGLLFYVTDENGFGASSFKNDDIGVLLEKATNYQPTQTQEK